MKFFQKIRIDLQIVCRVGVLCRSAKPSDTKMPSRFLRKLLKVFARLFLKGGAVEGAEPSSPSADGEILPSARRFLFAKLFLCAFMVKEKAAMDFMHFDH